MQIDNPGYHAYIANVRSLIKAIMKDISALRKGIAKPGTAPLLPEDYQKNEAYLPFMRFPSVEKITNWFKFNT